MAGGVPKRVTILDLFSGIFNVARNPVHKSPLSVGVRRAGRIVKAQLPRTWMHCAPGVTEVLRNHYLNVAESPQKAPKLWWGNAMGLIEVNASVTGLSGMDALYAALEAQTTIRRVTVLTHGLRFAPGDPVHCPHSHILSFQPRACWKALSWPTHLHLDRRDDVLGVAFGWPARGPLPQVADRAFEIGQHMSHLIRAISVKRPDVRVNVMAHSLGARVALAALSDVPAGLVDTMILLSGAEYRATALAAMTSPAGRHARVLNVASRENAVFDGLFRLCVPAPTFGDRALSAGLRDVPGWVDLRIDCPRHHAELSRLGVRTTRGPGRVCHWSTYLKPGMFKLYRRILDPEDPALLPFLARRLATTSPSARTTARPPALWSGVRS